MIPEIRLEVFARSVIILQFTTMLVMFWKKCDGIQVHGQG
jgi:hypothetical protein